MKKFIILFLVCLLCGCANIKHGLEGFAYGTDRVEIEKAYEKGEITKAEYLDLKQQDRTSSALENIKR